MSAASRRVVITGIGMVSTPAGTSVTSFDARPYFRMPKAVKLASRATQFAVAAASMALTDAAWPATDTANDQLGVVIGINGSDLQVEDLAHALRSDGEALDVDNIPLFAERILSGLNPLWLLVNLPNMPSAHVAIQLGARGPNNTVMTGWVAGLQAIGEAADCIRAGDANAVLAGGADSTHHPVLLSAYEQAGLLSSHNGDGSAAFRPSEGAGVVLLEERSHALARGARILGEIVGYASAALPTGALAQTMTTAMHEAGWQAASVGTVLLSTSPHSSSRDDEDAALVCVFGEHAATLTRFDVQADIGHAAAALGPISLCRALGDLAETRGLMANATGLSGQAVSLAVAAASRQGAAS